MCTDESKQYDVTGSRGDGTGQGAVPGKDAGFGYGAEAGQDAEVGRGDGAGTDARTGQAAAMALHVGAGQDVGIGQAAGIGDRFAEPAPITIPPKLYRIGEVIEHSGLSRQTVHNYTTMGLLIEVRRTDGGHRLYDESVFERLSGIIALKAQHKSLAHIREYYAKLDAG
jgi:hypothetical protein